MTRSASAAAAPPAAAHTRHEIRLTAVHLALFVGSAGGLVLVLFRRVLLPDRFFYDGDKIQSIIEGTAVLHGDKAFESVAAAYAWIGLGSAPVVAGVLGFAVLVGVMVLIRHRLRDIDPPMAVSALIVVCLLIGAVYLGYFGKEVFVLVVVALALALPAHARAEAIFAGVVVLYAALLRDYWLLVLVLYLCLRIARRLSPRVSVMGVAVAAAVLVVALVGFGVYLDVSPDHFRTMLNATRIGDPDAQSMIVPMFAGDSSLDGILNVGATLVFLVAPAPLALAGGIYYVILAVLFLFVWVMFLAGMGRAAPRRADPPAVQSHGVVDRAVCLVLAFLIIQAFFEPDYGSALRHMAPLLPLMAYVAWSGLGARTPAEERRA